MKDWTTFLGAVQLGGWVIYPLSVLAIFAIAIVIDRSYVFLRFARTPGGSTRAAADMPFPGPAGEALDSLPAGHVFRRLSVPLADQPSAPIWYREAKAETIAATIERDMSKGFWVLETIVTAAPLLGLLGTIVGMMHSFQLFGGNGLVNPGGVTGGVAQSLVATAVGLVVALFSLFTFNYFSRRLERLMDELETFANEQISEMRLASEGQGDTP
ncbi:MotA/TolQ/ExbB proton channel family protein (plasmid) [Paraburkholderia sprentiae WSM5005]|uniref:MotA/TolQ/ExbB proton channel family protein n=1 Tax=Paraburkholderia sprentiae WSM5005 TaxID=754502 RepID=A0A1I9YUR0_9BURK|nr:MotA/TolQ/ExbB proton channel family protein [Paraburkholderia sprentiae]APA89948.1 MotA/TolQ/ExbB proton channel family protein [Paraburkholderia sprentiae WSM5005]